MGQRAGGRAAIAAGSIVLAAALLWAFPAPALDPARSVLQYRLQTWRTRDGLPQSSVESIVQGHDGYLWFGTQEGLARFDGMRFTVFDKTTTPALRHNRIVALAAGSGGAVWIGSEGGGLARYHRGVFAAWTEAEGLPSNRVRAVAIGPDGTVWIGTDRGLCRLLGERIDPAIDPGQPTGRVDALSLDAAGELWVGCREGLFRRRSGTYERVTGQGLPPGEGVQALRHGADSSLWAGTKEGLVRLRGGLVMETFGPKEGLNGGGVTAIAEDPDGNVWAGTQRKGLYRLTAGQLSNLSASAGLSNDQIRALCLDREGNLWAGTQDGGVNQLADTRFTNWGTREGLSHDIVSPILEDRAGSVWIGTRGGGLDRIRSGRITVLREKDGLGSDWVQSLAEDRSGALWIGTLKGLSRLEGGKLRTFRRADGLSGESVRALVEDRAGNLWIGTNGGGLFRHRAGVFTRFGREEGLTDDSIFHLLEGRDGTLWIGTNGGGLNRMKDGKITALTTKDGLSNDIVNTIHEDAEGTLWIGTYGGGLSRLRDGRFRSFTSKDGLYDDAVFQLLEDGRGNFWISCNKGVYRIARAQLEEMAAGTRTRLSPVAYGVRDGMRNAECNGADQPAGWRMRDGRLWFPTIEGAVVIDPSLPDRPRPPLPVILEEIVANGKAVDRTGAVVLAPGLEKLDVHYTSPGFHAPQETRFRFRLDGFDREWVDVGTRRTAYYTHLPAGAYVFRVEASDEPGVWKDGAAEQAFQVMPRITETWAFYALAAFSLGLAVFAFVRLRIARLVARERDLILLVERRTRTLRDEKERTERALEEAERQRELAHAAGEAAEEANRTKSQFLANTSHELRTPLNAILGYSELLTEVVRERGIDGVEEDLSRIHSAGRHLLGLINDILDLSKIEAGKMEILIEETPVEAVVEDVVSAVRPLAEKNGNRIDTFLSHEAGTIWTDPTRLRQILLNLLGNAAKFTSHGSIVLAFERHLENGSEWVRFRVSDSGIGMSPDQVERLFIAFTQVETQTARRFGGTGLGLAISKKLSEMMGGDLYVESERGRGTTFTVRLPAQRRLRRPDAASSSS